MKVRTETEKPTITMKTLPGLAQERLTEYMLGLGGGNMPRSNECLEIVATCLQGELLDAIRAFQKGDVAYRACIALCSQDGYRQAVILMLREIQRLLRRPLELAQDDVMERFMKFKLTALTREAFTRFSTQWAVFQVELAEVGIPLLENAVLKAYFYRIKMPAELRARLRQEKQRYSMLQSDAEVDTASSIGLVPIPGIVEGHFDSPSFWPYEKLVSWTEKICHEATTYVSGGRSNTETALPVTTPDKPSGALLPSMRKCAKCKGVGHNEKQCPTKTVRAEEARNIQENCAVCSGTGHTAVHHGGLTPGALKHAQEQTARLKEQANQLKEEIRLLKTNPPRPTTGREVPTPTPTTGAKGNGRGNGKGDGTRAPRQPKGENQVCTDWLNGTCKDSSKCGKMHKKRPEPCRSFERSGKCRWEDRCIFQHVKGEKVELILEGQPKEFPKEYEEFIQSLVDYRPQPIPDYVHAVWDEDVNFLRQHGNGRGGERILVLSEPTPGSPTEPDTPPTGPTGPPDSTGPSTRYPLPLIQETAPHHGQDRAQILRLPQVPGKAVEQWHAQRRQQQEEAQSRWARPYAQMQTVQALSLEAPRPSSPLDTSDTEPDTPPTGPTGPPDSTGPTGPTHAPEERSAAIMEMTGFPTAGLHLALRGIEAQRDYERRLREGEVVEADDAFQEKAEARAYQANRARLEHGRRWEASRQRPARKAGPPQRNRLSTGLLEPTDPTGPPVSIDVTGSPTSTHSTELLPSADLTGTPTPTGETATVAPTGKRTRRGGRKSYQKRRARQRAHRLERLTAVRLPLVDLDGSFREVESRAAWSAFPLGPDGLDFDGFPPPTFTKVRVEEDANFEIQPSLQELLDDSRAPSDAEDLQEVPMHRRARGGGLMNSDVSSGPGDSSPWNSDDQALVDCVWDLSPSDQPTVWLLPDDPGPLEEETEVYLLRYQYPENFRLALLDAKELKDCQRRMKRSGVNADLKEHGLGAGLLLVREAIAVRALIAIKGLGRQLRAGEIVVGRGRHDREIGYGPQPDTNYEKWARFLVTKNCRGAGMPVAEPIKLPPLGVPDEPFGPLRFDSSSSHWSDEVTPPLSPVSSDSSRSAAPRPRPVQPKYIEDVWLEDQRHLERHTAGTGREYVCTSSEEKGAVKYARPKSRIAPVVPDEVQGALPPDSLVDLDEEPWEEEAVQPAPVTLIPAAQAAPPPLEAAQDAQPIPAQVTLTPADPLDQVLGQLAQTPVTLRPAVQGAQALEVPPYEAEVPDYERADEQHAWAAQQSEQAPGADWLPDYQRPFYAAEDWSDYDWRNQDWLTYESYSYSEAQGGTSWHGTPTGRQAGDPSASAGDYFSQVQGWNAGQDSFPVQGAVLTPASRISPRPPQQAGSRISPLPPQPAEPPPQRKAPSSAPSKGPSKGKGLWSAPCPAPRYDSHKASPKKSNVTFSGGQGYEGEGTHAPRPSFAAFSPQPSVQAAQEWVAESWSRQGKASLVSRFLRTEGFPRGCDSDTGLSDFKESLRHSCHKFGKVHMYFRFNKKREIVGEVYLGFLNPETASKAYAAHGRRCLWGRQFAKVNLATTQDNPTAWTVGGTITMEQICMQKEGSPTDSSPTPSLQVECVVCKQPATGFCLCRRCFGNLGCTNCGEDREGGFVCKDCLAEDRGPPRDPPSWLSSQPLAPWIERSLEEVVPCDGVLPRLHASPPSAAVFPNVIDLNSLARYGFAGPNAVAEWVQVSQANVYVGGECDKPGADSSPWDNHFGQDEEGLAKYEAFIRDRESPSVFELRGKVLGCWCVAPHCHALVLRRLIEESTFSTIGVGHEWILSGNEDTDSLAASFVQVSRPPSLGTWDTVESGGAFSDATSQAVSQMTSGPADATKRVCDKWLRERACDRPDCANLHCKKLIVCRKWQKGGCPKDTTCPAMHTYGTAGPWRMQEGTDIVFTKQSDLPEVATPGDLTPQQMRDLLGERNGLIERHTVPDPQWLSRRAFPDPAATEQEVCLTHRLLYDLGGCPLREEVADPACSGQRCKAAHPTDLKELRFDDQPLGTWLYHTPLPTTFHSRDQIGGIMYDNEGGIGVAHQIQLDGTTSSAKQGRVPQARRVRAALLVLSTPKPPADDEPLDLYLVLNEQKKTCSIPGGGFEATDETLEAAAVRELQEETGIPCEGCPISFLAEHDNTVYFFMAGVRSVEEAEEIRAASWAERRKQTRKRGYPPRLVSLRVLGYFLSMGGGRERIPRDCIMDPVGDFTKAIHASDGAFLVKCTDEPWFDHRVRSALRFWSTGELPPLDLHPEALLSLPRQPPFTGITEVAEGELYNRWSKTLLLRHLARYRVQYTEEVFKVQHLLALNQEVCPPLTEALMVEPRPMTQQEWESSSPVFLALRKGLLLAAGSFTDSFRIAPSSNTQNYFQNPPAGQLDGGFDHPPDYWLGVLDLLKGSKYPLAVMGPRVDRDCHNVVPPGNALEMHTVWDSMRLAHVEEPSAALHEAGPELPLPPFKQQANLFLREAKSTLVHQGRLISMQEDQASENKASLEKLLDETQTERQASLENTQIARSVLDEIRNVFDRHAPVFRPGVGDPVSSKKDFLELYGRYEGQPGMLSLDELAAAPSSSHLRQRREAVRLILQHYSGTPVLLECMQLEVSHPPPKGFVQVLTADASIQCGGADVPVWNPPVYGAQTPFSRPGWETISLWNPGSALWDATLADKNCWVRKVSVNAPLAGLLPSPDRYFVEHWVSVGALPRPANSKRSKYPVFGYRCLLCPRRIFDEDSADFDIVAHFKEPGHRQGLEQHLPEDHPARWGLLDYESDPLWVELAAWPPEDPPVPTRPDWPEEPTVQVRPPWPKQNTSDPWSNHSPDGWHTPLPSIQEQSPEPIGWPTKAADPEPQRWSDQPQAPAPWAAQQWDPQPPEPVGWPTASPKAIIQKPPKRDQGLGRRAPRAERAPSEDRSLESLARPPLPEAEVSWGNAPSGQAHADWWMEKVRCTKCNGRGHQEKNCPKPKPPREAPTVPNLTDKEVEDLNSEAPLPPYIRDRCNPTQLASFGARQAVKPVRAPSMGREEFRGMNSEYTAQPEHLARLSRDQQMDWTFRRSQRTYQYEQEWLRGPELDGVRNALRPPAPKAAPKPKAPAPTQVWSPSGAPSGEVSSVIYEVPRYEGGEQYRDPRTDREVADQFERDSQRQTDCPAVSLRKPWFRSKGARSFNQLAKRAMRWQSATLPALRSCGLISPDRGIPHFMEGLAVPNLPPDRVFPSSYCSAFRVTIAPARWIIIWTLESTVGYLVPWANLHATRATRWLSIFVIQAMTDVIETRISILLGWDQNQCFQPNVCTGRIGEVPGPPGVRDGEYPEARIQEADRLLGESQRIIDATHRPTSGTARQLTNDAIDYFDVAELSVRTAIFNLDPVTGGPLGQYGSDPVSGLLASGYAEPVEAIPTLHRYGAFPQVKERRFKLLGAHNGDSFYWHPDRYCRRNAQTLRFIHHDGLTTISKGDLCQYELQVRPLERVRSLEQYNASDHLDLEFTSLDHDFQWVPQYSQYGLGRGYKDRSLLSVVHIDRPSRQLPLEWVTRPFWTGGAQPWEPIGFRGREPSDKGVRLERTSRASVRDHVNAASEWERSPLRMCRLTPGEFVALLLRPPAERAIKALANTLVAGLQGEEAGCLAQASPYLYCVLSPHRMEWRYAQQLRHLLKFAPGFWPIFSDLDNSRVFDDHLRAVQRADPTNEAYFPGTRVTRSGARRPAYSYPERADGRVEPSDLAVTKQGGPLSQWRSVNYGIPVHQSTTMPESLAELLPMSAMPGRQQYGGLLTRPCAGPPLDLLSYPGHPRKMLSEVPTHYVTTGSQCRVEELLSRGLTPLAMRFCERSATAPKEDDPTTVVALPGLGGEVQRLFAYAGLRAMRALGNTCHGWAAQIRPYREDWQMVTILQAAVACDWLVHETRTLRGLATRELHRCWILKRRYLYRAGLCSAERIHCRQLAAAFGGEVHDFALPRPIPHKYQVEEVRKVLFATENKVRFPGVHESRPSSSIKAFLGPTRKVLYVLCLDGLRFGYSESYVRSFRHRVSDIHNGYDQDCSLNYQDVVDEVDITPSATDTNLSTIAIPHATCHGATGKAGGGRCCACGASETATFKLQRCMGWCGPAECGFCPPGPGGSNACSTLMRGTFGELYRTCACCIWGIPPVEALGMITESPTGLSASTGWESPPHSDQSGEEEFRFADGTTVSRSPLESQTLLEDGDQIIQVTLHLISTATKEVLIASPWLDAGDVICALAAAHLRGVEVLALVSTETFGRRTWPFPTIATEGRPLGALYPGRVGQGHDHDKVLVVDQRHGLVGSFNFTEAAKACNRELMVWTTDGDFAQQLAQRLLSKRPMFAFTPLDEDEKCRLEPFTQGIQRRVLRRWHDALRMRTAALFTSGLAALAALEEHDAAELTQRGEDSLDAEEPSDLWVTQQRAAVVSNALHRSGLAFTTIAELARISVPQERKVRNGVLRQLGGWTRLLELPQTLAATRQLPDRLHDLTTAIPVNEGDDPEWTFKSGTFKGEPFENVFISSPEAARQVCRKIVTDEVLTEDWRSFIGWIMANHPMFLPMEVRQHFEADAALAAAFGCTQLDPKPTPFISTPVRVRSRRLQGSQPENHGLGNFGEVVNMIEGDETVRIAAERDYVPVHLPGVQGIPQKDPPPSGYHHRAVITFGLPMAELSDGWSGECVMDTGASTNIMPVQVLQELLRADAQGRTGLTREIIVSLIKWKRPIPFSGVFGSHLCEYGVVVHATFDGIFSRPLCFRVLQTRDILIGAPTLDISGWNSSAFTFEAYGSTGGPTGLGFVQASRPSRTSNR